MTGSKLVGLLPKVVEEIETWKGRMLSRDEIGVLLKTIGDSITEDPFNKITVLGFASGDADCAGLMASTCYIPCADPDVVAVPEDLCGC